MGYVETRTFYVAHLASWDLMLGQPALESVRAVIPAGQNPVTIQPNGMPQFSLTPWRRPSTSKNATAGIASAVLEVTNILNTDSSSLEDTIDPAIHTTWYAEQEDDCIIVNASSVTPNFNSVKEFPELFLEYMPKEMPSNRAINYFIIVKEGSTWKPTFKPTQNRLKKAIMDKITQELDTGRLYYPTQEITNAVVLFTQPKKDRSNEPRFLLDCSPCNLVTEPDYTPLPNIEEFFELVTSCFFWSKIDLGDGFHNIAVAKESEIHNAIMTLLGPLISRIMQQGNRNAPATMVKLMHYIFSNIVYKCVVIYLDDIFIYNGT